MVFLQHLAHAKYTAEDVAAHFAKLRRAGFNLIMDYATYKLGRPEDRARFYGLCATNGIRVIADDFAELMRKPETIETGRQKVRDLLRYPAIIGWYTMDEASPDKIPVLTRIRREGREPTENEMLSVALLYAAWGVKGFLFYSYFDLYKCPIPEWIPRRWEAIVNVAAALRSLEPFIMSGDAIRQVAHTDVKGSHRIVVLSDGKGRHRVLVIGLTRNNEATFTLPAEYGKLSSRCGNGIWHFEGPEFTCDTLQ